MNEFENTLNTLAATPGRSLKQMLFETGRGVWSLPPAVPINQAAARVLAASKFILHAAEVAPGEIPQCLWRFLPAETQMLVASTQNVNHVPEDAGLERMDDEEDEEIVKAMLIKRQQAQAAPAPPAAPPPPPPVPRVSSGADVLHPRHPPTSVPHHSTPQAGGYVAAARDNPPRQPQPPAGTSVPSNASPGVALDSLLSAGIAVGLAAYTTQQQHQGSPAINVSSVHHLPAPTAVTGGNGAVFKEEPARLALPQTHYPDRIIASTHHQAPMQQGGLAKRPRSDDEEDDVALFNATKQQRAAGGKVKQRNSVSSHPGDEEDVQLFPPATRAPAALPTVNVPLVHPNLAASSFGIEDVRELNQLMDVMFLERNSMGPGGTTLIKNMAEAAANVSMIIYLMTYRLPAAATVGIDEKLAALKTRAYLVYNGVVNSEPMEVLLPFSELLSAESGMMRRTLEAQSRAAGIPATAAGILNPYDGGEGVNYNVW